MPTVPIISVYVGSKDGARPVRAARSLWCARAAVGGRRAENSGRRSSRTSGSFLVARDMHPRTSHVIRSTRSARLRRRMPRLAAWCDAYSSERGRRGHAGRRNQLRRLSARRKRCPSARVGCSCFAKRAALTSNPEESGAVGRAVIFELRGAGEPHVSGRPRRVSERHKKCAPARAPCCALSKARGRHAKRRGERSGTMHTQFEWARRGRARCGPTRPRRAPKNGGRARNDRGLVVHACARAVGDGAGARQGR